MDQLAYRFIEIVSQQDNLLGWAALALAAFIEYVFPPFPGDMIGIFSGFLVGSKGWSLVAVFVASLAGSGAGAMTAFAFGRALARREQAGSRRHPKAHAQIERIVARFRSHGEAFLVVNRFVPGLRIVVFVAAGMADLRPRWVLVWALVSAGLWYALLITIGTTIGANFEQIRSLFTTYNQIVWAVIATVALGLVARRLWLRRRQRRAGAGEESNAPPPAPPASPETQP